MKRFLIYISVLLIIPGCKYNPTGENYKDISKPAENPLFDLTVIPEMDTIDIFARTLFSYTFNSHGLEMKSAQFNIDGKGVELIRDMKTIGIDPQYYQEGYHVLSMVIYTNSGTGSIADVAGAEGYKIEKKWVLNINSNPIIPIVKTITKEGFLKLSWRKLKVPDFIKMELTYSYNNVYVSKTMDNMNTTFFLDSNYVGGRSYFQLYCAYNTRDVINVHASLSINDTLPQLHFEDISADSVRIYWKKSAYNVKYKLVNTQAYPVATLLNGTSDTTCKAVQPVLGSSGYYILYINPIRNNTEIWNTESDQKAHTLGSRIVA